MAPDVVAIAQALIRCRSVTPTDDGALDHVANLLSGAGFSVERPSFSEPGMPPVPNLYARLGSGRPCLAFAGHTDVVPPGDVDAWRHDPFGGTLEDGWLYGRGAVDMKGGLAAMLRAALDFASRHPGGSGGSISFLVTGDEEGPAVNGMAKLLAWAAERGERLDHCIVGEPTNPERLGDTVKIGRRGSLTGRLTVLGRQGHVAYPQLARNPIPDLARAISALGSSPLDAGTDQFDRSSLEFTTVDVGNPATNVIPAEARAVFNVRFNDGWTAESLAEEIGTRLAAVLPSDCYELVFQPSNAPAFVTEPDRFADLVRDAVHAETGLLPQLSTTGGTSDARFIRAYCPVLEFGLVGATMHGIDERVAVADLQALTRIYARILATYLGEMGDGSSG